MSTGISALNMSNAPFGGRLGLRSGYSTGIPTPQITYYRWLYRPASGGAWTEFTETVKVHYIKEQGGTTTFPVHVLGPKSVAGKMLYEFRPHNAPTEPGATTSWPTTDWFGDIYSGFLNSTSLPDGKYTIKLEVFNSAGSIQTPGAAFRFIVPNGTGPGGSINTKVATSLDGAGVTFPLHVDNRHCGAFVAPPSIGGTAVADACGFLLYGAKSDMVRIAFAATHPANFAQFRFRLIRGVNEVGIATTGGEVGASSVGPYSGGSGQFAREFTVAQLLQTCPIQAAFSENLHVYAKATRGWGHRIAPYDAHYTRAFALAK